jgi:hypothetical protein
MNADFKGAKLEAAAISTMSGKLAGAQQRSFTS